MAQDSATKKRRRAPRWCVIVAGSLITATTALPVPVQRASAVSPAIGWLDSLVITTGGTALVSGWTLTADYPLSALGVRARIDGSYSIPAVNYRLAGTYRPDVGAAYPGYGNYHGFVFEVPFPPGSHTVCIEAQNSGVYNQLSGCRNASYNPSGSFRFLGGAYPGPIGTTTTIPWARSNGTYSSEVSAGVASWAGLAPHIVIGAEIPYGGATEKATFLIGSFSYLIGGAWGLAQQPPCWHYETDSFPTNTNCSFSRGVIYLNTQSLNAEPSAQRQKVVAHELGHTLGLGHQNSPGVPTVMSQGYIGGNVSGTPAFFDGISLQILYP